MTTTAADRPLRADAARNRALIVEAARRLFAEHGLEVTLHDVAAEAGVGVGTVYRRFEDKEALLVAVLEAKYAALVELAEAATAQPTGREALRHYLSAAMERRARDKALSESVMRAIVPTAGVLRQRADLTELTGGFIGRARGEGALREGFGADDVPVLIGMVGSVADRARETDPEVWRRYARLLVDSVCPPAGEVPRNGTPLTGVAPPSPLSGDRIRC